MGRKIFGLLVSIFLIAGGASGQLVLRGTNSSKALIVAGFIFLILDIYSIATHKKSSEKMKRLQQETEAVYTAKYAHPYPGKKKGWAIAWWLLGYFGFFGFHSFYLGKKKAGLLKIAALLAIGIIMGITGKFIEDAGGSGGNPLMILPSSFCALAILIWNIVDLVKIIRLPKVAFEAETRDFEKIYSVTEPAKQDDGAAGPKNILERYRAGLSYLDGCSAFDEAKFREFNRITGNRFSEADIENQLKNAKMMIRGMEDLKQTLRSATVEGIRVFEDLERNGLDLSKYNV